MLGLIGIKKGVDVSIREKLVISPRTKDLISNSLKNITDEFVILSTCNRTEIYFKGQDINKELIFEILNWDKSLLEYVFYIEGENSVKHLFELACGYKSLPVGGIDGTLKNRMKSAATFRNVHAKTGSFTAINTLAGYLKMKNGHEVAFAIMNQNVLSAAKARAFQDKVCEVIIGK